MSPPLPNFKRMMAIIDEVFATRTDPNQLQVNEEVMTALEKIHPSTLSELANANGPYCWVLLIPTHKQVMEDFLARKISETDILLQTRVGESYDSIYLCSASTLPEYRSQGITKKLCLQSIESIRQSHPINALFVWPFTNEGVKLAESVAKSCKLPLLMI
ncbi:MAG: hypothetical protein IT236_15420 [Bacteroidia bacterium]|nr:hypothetical protein [Bacteroidia bacterium]